MAKTVKKTRESQYTEILADIQAHDNTTGDYYIHKYIEEQKKAGTL